MIYFVECQTTRLVKVGYCRSNLDDRLKKMRCDSATLLDLVSLIDGDVFAEKALHRRFSADRHHGEWFALRAHQIPPTQHALEPYRRRMWVVRTCPNCGRQKWGRPGAAPLRQGKKLPSCSCRTTNRRVSREALRRELATAGVSEKLYDARRAKGDSHDQALDGSGARARTTAALALAEAQRKPPAPKRTRTTWACAGACGRVVTREGGRCQPCWKRQCNRTREQRRRAAGVRLSNARIQQCIEAGIAPSTYTNRRRRGIPHSEAIDPRPRRPGRPPKVKHAR